MTLAAVFGGLTAAIVAAIIGAAVLLTPTAGACSPAASKLADTAIPSDLMPLYHKAENKYRVPWNVLAAINQIETDFGRLKAPGVTSGENFAGAGGPMQFLAGTWAAYGVDGNQDGRKDRYDPEDAIPAAARYLKASGAPGDMRRAIFAYNRADWYVNKVLALAGRYAADPATTAPVGDCTADTGGPVEGTPKHIIDTIALPISRASGVPRTVEENDAGNASHGPTVNQTPSDHQGPPDQAWAADLSNGSSPTPEMDRLAEALAKRFRIPWDGSGLVTHETGGYRYQLIYRCNPCGGNHMNHVHIGVRRVAQTRST